MGTPLWKGRVTTSQNSGFDTAFELSFIALSLRDATPTTYSQYVYRISGMPTSRWVPQRQVTGIFLIQGTPEALRSGICLCFKRDGHYCVNAVHLFPFRIKYN